MKLIAICLQRNLNKYSQNKIDKAHEDKEMYVKYFMY